MKCPKCESEIVKKVHVLRPDWSVGLHECLSCDFKGDWTDFGALLFAAKSPSPTRKSNIGDG